MFDHQEPQPTLEDFENRRAEIEKSFSFFEDSPLDLFGVTKEYAALRISFSKFEYAQGEYLSAALNALFGILDSMGASTLDPTNPQVMDSPWRFTSVEVTLPPSGPTSIMSSGRSPKGPPGSAIAAPSRIAFTASSKKVPVWKKPHIAGEAGEEAVKQYVLLRGEEIIGQRIAFRVGDDTFTVDLLTARNEGRFNEFFGIEAKNNRSPLSGPQRVQASGQGRIRGTAFGRQAKKAGIAGKTFTFEYQIIRTSNGEVVKVIVPTGTGDYLLYSK